ncbi:MAG: hypothetical protein N2645_09625 [Clostridia bacterium]|nr:hypothetical protein [Clostridia bacterium]
MLINMNLTIAYKCAVCGAFEFFSLPLFKLIQKKEIKYSCKCTKTGITVFQESQRDVTIKMPCIGCGGEHTFILSRKDIICRAMNILYCPVTGVPQCFAGNDQEVRRKIDSLEKELDELIDMFGYESYFKNTQVMFDTLNKVHDIAEQGNLYCECGNNDIELVLLPDKICLNCRKCAGKRIINAATNEDLKIILMQEQILLFAKYSKSYLQEK